MSSTPPLLFLDFEGVLVLQSAVKYQQIADALRTVGSGKADIEDFTDEWQGLFERRARENLKALDAEFQLTYCLTLPWAQMVDKANMIRLLRRGGLEFVASRLHPRWEAAATGQTNPRSQAVTSWLKVHGIETESWFVLDAGSSGTDCNEWPDKMLTHTIACISDVGFTDFEAEKLRIALQQRIHLI